MCGAHEKIVGRNMENIHPGQVEDRTEREIGTGHQFNETNSIMTEKTGGKRVRGCKCKSPFPVNLLFHDAYYPLGNNFVLTTTMDGYLWA
jgi:hypothetical protein